MSAIYSSYRDVSGIATPGMAWIILTVAPIAAVFATTGAASLVAWYLARQRHPKWSQARLKPVAV